jgi:hypothetical protein
MSGVAVRLSGGVVTGRGQRVWAPGRSRAPIDSGAAGAAVVVGPDDADEDTITVALW